jgi:(p)ppGpp synthase/HD superfamily hydrolase
MDDCTFLGERFDTALLFASSLHRGQHRKGTTIPYLSHLLGVTGLVLESGGDEDEAIAALLHDSIEDQGDEYPGGRAALRRCIAERFGDKVLAIVNACTDDDRFPKAATAAEQSAALWKQRKQAYIARLASASPSVRRVACADKLHNTRSILADYRECGERVWERFRTRSREDQIWYYGELVRIFRGSGKLAAELEITWKQLWNGSRL